MAKRTVELRGVPPTAGPDVEGPAMLMALVCTPAFKNGVLVALDFSPLEYHVRRHVRSDGEVSHSAVSVMAEDREFFPNWPKPETATSAPYTVEEVIGPSGQVKWRAWDGPGREYSIYPDREAAESVVAAWRETAARLSRAVR